MQHLKKLPLLGKLFKDWTYGFIEGLIVALLIAVLFLPLIQEMILACLFANLLFSLMVWLEVRVIPPRKEGVARDTQKPEPETVTPRTYKTCPECGNKTMHKVGCSKRKKQP